MGFLFPSTSACQVQPPIAPLRGGKGKRRKENWLCGRQKSCVVEYHQKYISFTFKRERDRYIDRDIDSTSQKRILIKYVREKKRDKGGCDKEAEKERWIDTNNKSERTALIPV